jgi:hypothetical protein
MVSWLYPWLMMSSPAVTSGASIWLTLSLRYRYMGANIPGKAREQLIYLAGVDVYAQEIRKALDGWKGFNVKMKAHAEGKGIESKVAELNLTQGVR